MEIFNSTKIIGILIEGFYVGEEYFIARAKYGLRRALFCFSNHSLIVK